MPWRPRRVPRRFRNTASESSREAQRSGSICPRPGGASHSPSASRARRPSGATRSLDPLPSTRNEAEARSTSPSDSPTSSETRTPVP